MNAVTTRKEIAAGFALAALTLCAGFWFSVRAGELGATALMRIFGLIAILIVVKYTFALGRLRGFPARRGDGRLHFENCLRNLFAAAIVFFCVMWLSGPFVAAIVTAGR